jgi:hypothetical protein
MDQDYFDGLAFTISYGAQAVIEAKEWYTNLRNAIKVPRNSASKTHNFI